MHTGQRQGDLRKLPWSAYDGERIRLRQGKGGGKVAVSIGAQRRSSSCSTICREASAGPLILTTQTGRALTKRYFAEQWQEALKRSEIVDLSCVDLPLSAISRKTSATSSAGRGTTAAG
jgi:hypothetical protein